jgi:hypothetical protein
MSRLQHASNRAAEHCSSSKDHASPRAGTLYAVQGLFSASWLSVQAQSFGNASADEDFGKRSTVHLVARRAMIGIQSSVIVVALGVTLGISTEILEYSAVGGTLAIFIPTRSGLVIAADMRTSPQGVFCDGINKILIPKRPPHTAVVVTGSATILRDTSTIPLSELCAYIARTAAPIDFWKKRG